ncbi:hypothetical protein O3M35_006038 [Rhynocoris fuscipes]|uniref:Uncharacterized protein n=1 Tax=Rhynocoris fuscipes TaxID=488301 RepID=A0AAW1DEE5_9HEMI
MKCTEAFSALWPDEQLIINKEKIEALLKVVLGDLYNDDVSRVLIDAMGPDENGNVTLENFFHTFSLDCWSHDSLAAMQLVLTNSPEVINQVANWKSVLKTLGFDLGDLEVQQLINKANECAKEILKLALEKSSTATEVNRNL